MASLFIGFIRHSARLFPTGNHPKTLGTATRGHRSCARQCHRRTSPSPAIVRHRSLDYTLPLALRVKNAGLQFMLDFHYSDSWADPGQQTKPAAWTNLTFTQIAAQMRQYNSNCIAVFKAAGATPDYLSLIHI